MPLLRRVRLASSVLITLEKGGLHVLAFFYFRLIGDLIFGLLGFFFLKKEDNYAFISFAVRIVTLLSTFSKFPNRWLKLCNIF